MKIALLHDDFPPYHEGGSGVIALQLAKEFVANGHQVLVITAVMQKEQAGESREGGIRVARIYSNYPAPLRAYVSLYNPRVLREVSRLLKAFAPDVAHVHNVHLHLSYYSVRLARRYARRVYMTAHDAMSFHYDKLPSAGEQLRAGYLGSDTYRESFWRQLLQHRVRYNPLRTPIVRSLLNANLDGVVAVSAALARALRANGINNVSVIHNGIDAAAWQRPPSAAADKSAWKVGEAAILIGGRLSGMKGAYQMLDALKDIGMQVPQAQLLVVGKKDAQGEKIAAYAQGLGIGERLVFTGWITGEQLRSAYYAAAVVAVPSIYLDPFPTVNLEAFACHKPVVATCYGGSPEIVEDGVTGYIVDPLDARALGAKITELLLDRRKREAFGEHGYERVVRDFSLTGQAAAYEKLFT